MSNLKPKQSILNSLILEGKSSVSELSSLTGYSRVTVSKELEQLLDLDIVKKDGTKYVLCDTSVFVLLKIHKNFSEAVCFSSNKVLLKRNRIDMLYSLPYKDNITFISTSIQRTFSSDLENSEHPYLCVVYDDNIDLSSIISKKFTVRESRSQLIADHLAKQYPDKSVIYLNTSDGFSALCFNGACIGTSSVSERNIASALESCFNIFKPQAIVLEGKPNESIVELCRKENIDFSFLSNELDLYIDEKQLLLECLCKI